MWGLKSKSVTLICSLVVTGTDPLYSKYNENLNATSKRLWPDFPRLIQSDPNLLHVHTKYCRISFELHRETFLKWHDFNFRVSSFLSILLFESNNQFRNYESWIESFNQSDCFWQKTTSKKQTRLVKLVLIK